MQNPSNSAVSAKTQNLKINAMTKARQTKIAALIAQGDSIKDVTKKVNMSDSRIYHLLSEKDSFVNAEINRILNEMFAVTDRHLINLYTKALQKLDGMLSSHDEEKQYRAIDRIIKIYAARTSKNAFTIQQYLGIQSQEEKDPIKTIDDIILKKRKERGLPMPDYHEDSTDSSPDDSSPDDFFPNASSPNSIA
jgi:DNA anti-recombination protein RmuC